MAKEIMTYTKEYYFTYVKPRLEKASEIYEQMLIEEASEKERKRKKENRRRKILKDYFLKMMRRI